MSSSGWTLARKASKRGQAARGSCSTPQTLVIRSSRRCSRIAPRGVEAALRLGPQERQRAVEDVEQQRIGVELDRHRRDARAGHVGLAEAGDVARAFRRPAPRRELVGIEHDLAVRLDLDDAVEPLAAMLGRSLGELALAVPGADLPCGAWSARVSSFAG
jgi:hypothetical protein